MPGIPKLRIFLKGLVRQQGKTSMPNQQTRKVEFDTEFHAYYITPKKFRLPHLRFIAIVDDLSLLSAPCFQLLHYFAIRQQPLERSLNLVLAKFHDLFYDRRS